MCVSATGGSDFAVSVRGPRGGREEEGHRGHCRGPHLRAAFVVRLRCFIFCVRYRQKLQVRELCAEFSAGTMIHDEHILKDGRGGELIDVEVYEFELGVEAYCDGRKRVLKVLVLVGKLEIQQERNGKR